MNKAQQLMCEATEGEDFDARAYFLQGTLEAFGDRGFERMLDDPLEAWLLDVPPFYLWAYVDKGLVNISVELVLQGCRTLLNHWPYSMKELDAAIAQVDRIQPMVTHMAGVPGREEVCAKLRKMGKAPGVNEAEDVDDFDPREYLLSDTLAGFSYLEAAGAHTKSYPLADDVSIIVALYYNTPKAFVDVYVAVADKQENFGILKHLKGVPADDVHSYVNRVSHLVDELKDAGVASAREVIGLCNRKGLLESELESEQEFDVREYFLTNPWVAALKRMGYEKLDDDGKYSVYTKQLLSDLSTSHYLVVCVQESSDPTTVLVEYQKYVPVVGFMLPWSARVEYQKLRTLLPLLESAIKSAWEQQLDEKETKAVLDELVKV